MLFEQSYIIYAIYGIMIYITSRKLNRIQDVHYFHNNCTIIEYWSSTIVYTSTSSLMAEWDMFYTKDVIPFIRNKKYIVNTSSDVTAEHIIKYITQQLIYQL